MKYFYVFSSHLLYGLLFTCNILVNSDLDISRIKVCDFGNDYKHTLLTIFFVWIYLFSFLLFRKTRVVLFQYLALESVREMIWVYGNKLLTLTLIGSTLLTGTPLRLVNIWVIVNCSFIIERTWLDMMFLMTEFAANGLQATSRVQVCQIEPVSFWEKLSVFDLHFETGIIFKHITVSLFEIIGDLQYQCYVFCLVY